MRAILGVAVMLQLAHAQTPTLNVITFGGNEQDTVAGLAIDQEGNYLIAGTTASLDLPASGLQQRPGGAYLYRFQGSAATALYPPGNRAVSAIAADSTRAGRVFAAFDRAVWESRDSGDTWQRLEADWPADADCRQIVVSLRDARTLYVVCEGNRYPRFNPQYLFRSGDSGRSWTRIRIDGQELLNVVADPQNPLSLWAPGLIHSPQWSFLYGFHSVDGGATWSRVEANLTQFAFDPSREGVMYAAGHHGYYRRDDAGANWTKLSDPASPDMSVPVPFSASSISVLPSGEALFLYGNVLRRTRDRGASWQVFSLPEQFPCRDAYSGIDSPLSVDVRTGSIYLRMCGDPQAAIYRSDDAGASWVRISHLGLPQLTGGAVAAAISGQADYFAIARRSFDGFVAKLSPTGEVIWSTFLGGLHDDSITAMAADNGGNIYVIGTSSSDDFPVGIALARSDKPRMKSFVAKVSGDGHRLVYSTVYASDATARSIVTDNAGAAYITGNAGRSIPTTTGAYLGEAQGTAPNPFLLKIEPSGSRVAYGTFLAPGSYSVLSPLLGNAPQNLGIAANTVTADADGNAYVGGTYIWKVNPSGTGLVYSTRLDGATVNAVALDAAGNLYAGGSADTRTFYTTPGAFQISVLPTMCGFSLLGSGVEGCWANPAFVTKFNADASQILYSTLLGGDGGDSIRALAVTADGRAIAAGNTSSRAFPTRIPVYGPGLPLFGQNGFATALLADGSELAYSTYLSRGERINTVAVALDAFGEPVVAAHTIGPSGYGGSDIPRSDSDVLIYRFRYSEAGQFSARLDAIVNAASRTGTPIAAGQRVSLLGAGFTAGAKVWFGDTSVAPITIDDGEIIAVPPTVAASQLRISVELEDGRRSNEVLMPAGQPEVWLYSADGSGTGQVLALHEDGTLNSPANPARPGSVVTIPANGIDPGNHAGLGPLGGVVDGSVSFGAFPGLAGEVALIRATVDPRYRGPLRALPITGYRFPGRQPVTLAIAPL
ncbi:MAG TPA: SBBP repeat-containing protein [Bryobacteraceae bacterium]|nr:SBBP repeat-containing protein [Bryobacteraceae bacterium]